MEIRHDAPLIYADYCCFFSIGNMELFRAYQNFSCWENLHVHYNTAYQAVDMQAVSFGIV